MTTYVDDCDLDAAKPLRTAWLEKPCDAHLLQKTRCKCRHFSVSCLVCVSLRAITQRRSCGPIRVCTTTGQSGTPPGPNLLREQPCDPGARELIGILLFLSRCTRFDISLVIARLVRFVTCWCEWGSKGHQAHSRSLIMKSADDDWEVLRLSTFCDASFGARCFGGYKVDDRVGESPAGTAEHESNRARINRVGTSSQSDATRRRSTGQ